MKTYAASEPNANRILIALDGPSALALYRDRADLLSQTTSQETMASMAPSRDEDGDAWLSDEEVAASMAELRVFGRGAYEFSPYADELAGNSVPPLKPTRRYSLSSCAYRSKDLKRLPYDDLGLRPPSSDSPLYLLVPNASSIRRVKGVHERSCSCGVSSRSFRLLANDANVLVPTPELTFLLMAQYLSLEGLIMVGMELCGHYRLVGATTRTPLDSNRTLYDQQALTTPARLMQYLQRESSFRGARQALRACEYIAAHSASPMETALYVLLCLPRKLGGYALSQPILNAKRAVNQLAGSITLAHTLIPDLYWPSVRLDVEYDSEEFHSDPESLALGARRTLALRAMNVQVISVTKDILYDAEALDVAAKSAGRALHRRMPRPTDVFIQRRRLLRAAVLHNEGVYR